MGVTHDPGPEGPSGEGETVIILIFLSYIAMMATIAKKRCERLVDPPVSEEAIVPELTLPVDEESVEYEKNLDEYWTSSSVYEPSFAFRQRFIAFASCGLVRDGDYDQPTNNPIAFRVLYWLSGVNWSRVGIFFGVWIMIWLFLICLGLMSTGFKLLGGKDAASMFDVVDNPISGLMIGILATVLVQSSSTTTSIIIGLVGADELSVNTAIPMIMGANIGTSVTNTLVSLGHYSNERELQRGFAAATVHDCFNILSVGVLLPIEVVTNVFERITRAVAKNIDECNTDENDCEKQEFIKPYLKPYYNDVAKYDKKVANYVSQGYCAGKCDRSEYSDEALRSLTSMVCPTEHDCADNIDGFRNSWLNDNVLKSSRLPEYIRLSRSNVSDVVAAEYLYSCPLTDGCHAAQWFWNTTTDAPNYVPQELQDRTQLFRVCEDMKHDLCDARLLKGGIFYRDWHLSDETAGALCVWFSLSGLCAVLYLLVQSLNILVRGTVAKGLKRAVALNGYLSMLIGMFVTIMVQSSSITTSVLTPLVAIGIIPLEDMYPLTLGANVGTTVTGILAASVATSNPKAAWQVALAHLLFNLFGIMLWYPLQITRKVPLRMAIYLGEQTKKHKLFPIAYTTTVFFLLPGVVYGITTLDN